MADETQETAGRGIMVSYKELVEIRTKMERLDAKLDAALALRGEFDSLKAVVYSIQLELATARGQASGGGTVMKHVWNAVVGLGGALIGAVGGHYFIR